MAKVKLGNVKGADGKSAYELALQHGFEGTEEEWLESLKAEALKEVPEHTHPYLAFNPDTQALTQDGEVVTPSDLGAAVTSVYTVSVPLSWAADETNGGFKQTIAVGGILATDSPIADIVLGADVDANALYLESWGCITRITTADGSITLYANESAPETAFTMQMKVVR